MRAVAKFIAWLAKQAWKYGAKTVAAVTNWARKYWRAVEKWLNRGLTYGTIVDLILKQLGLF